MLRGVLLDVGGVMAVPKPAELARVVSGFGGIDDEAGLIRAHYAAMAAADSWDGFDWPTYHRQLLVACGVPIAARDECAAAMAEAVATVADWWSHQLAGVAEVLHELSSRVALGVVSNSDGTVTRVLSEMGLAQVGPGKGASVAVIIDSAVVGVEKPDPEIFRPAVEALDLPTESIAYVGDTLAFDMAGARAAGLHPIHMDPYGLCPEDADHDHIANLADLLSGLTPQRA
ncbi:MAG: HAD family hydrolase [Jatrophihabitans sp.]